MHPLRLMTDFAARRSQAKRALAVFARRLVCPIVNDASRWAARRVSSIRRERIGCSHVRRREARATPRSTLSKDAPFVLHDSRHGERREQKREQEAETAARERLGQRDLQSATPPRRRRVPSGVPPWGDRRPASTAAGARGRPGRIRGSSGPAGPCGRARPGRPRCSGCASLRAVRHGTPRSAS